MKDKVGDPAMLREYLLGRGDKNLGEQIEIRLLSDDALADLLAVAEGELIESFLDGELGPDETRCFSEHFLAAPDRRRQLRFTKNLRDISAERSAENISSAGGRLPVTTSFLVLLAVCLSVGAVGIWLLINPGTDDQRGLAILRDVYSTRRPTSSRLTAIPQYAPFVQTRGAEDAEWSRNRELAGRYLLEARTVDPNPRTHHALGIFYLTTGELDKAREEISLAASLAPENARIQSDAAAVFLESAQRYAAKDDGSAALRALDSSLRYSEASLSLDPDLKEGYFNRALCLEQLNFKDQAIEAWRSYIRKDPDSPWSLEARQHLEVLERTDRSGTKPTNVVSDFLAASEDGNEERARDLLRGSRELIRENYLPQRMAIEITKSPPGARNRYLEALRYGGEVEYKMTGDPFVKDVARFYLNANDRVIDRLRPAHEFMLSGYRFCLMQEFERALEVFEKARAAFDTEADVWESRIATYFVGYALVNSGNIEKGLRELEVVRGYAHKNGYLWLNATSLHWIGGGYVRTRRHSDALRTYLEAFGLAERVSDNYAMERNLIEISNRYAFAGQVSLSLKYLQRALKGSGSSASSRQRYRTLVDSYATLSKASLFAAAKFDALESVSQADRIGDDAWRSQARTIAADGQIEVRDLQAARNMLEEAASINESIPNEEARARQSAFISLKLGNLEKSAGDLDEAERYFRSARDYYVYADMPLNREEACYGLLKTFLSANKLAELQSMIPEAIGLTEEYRGRITEEAQRSSYLSSRSSIYDVATEFEYRRGDLRRSFDYTERSASRALLDRMSNGANVSGGPDGLQQIGLGGNVIGDSIEVLQNEIPDGVQVVQYSVLEDGILIWLVSRDHFTVREVKVRSDELSGKTIEFRKRIMELEGRDSPSFNRLAKELYGLLIAPIRSELDASRELCVIPTKFLENVPFAALIAPDERYLLAEFRLLKAPSMNAFVRASKNASQKNERLEESILAVGNPAFDQKKFAGIEYLPAAEVEAEKAAGYYRVSKLLIRKDATGEALLRQMDASDVVHFSGHYLSEAGSPDAGFLLTAKEKDGRSTISDTDLATLSLKRARLVVLASCRTGTGFTEDSENAEGMARTMLAINAPVVVASEWPVDSNATAKLMSRFHEFRKVNGMSTVSALRQAELELSSDTNGQFAAPYYWAAFSVFGGHALF